MIEILGVKFVYSDLVIPWKMDTYKSVPFLFPEFYKLVGL